MQSPDNMIISNYLDSVYLLYALALKYGMNKLVREELIHKICSLENFNYTEDGKMEEEAILVIIDYLYKRINAERKVIKPILQRYQKIGSFVFVLQSNYAITWDTGKELWWFDFASWL